MLTGFFFLLREGGLKVSITEFLTLLELLKQRVIRFDIDEFYYLSRACLVKDEALYDRFDRVFSAHFKGVQELFGPEAADLPEEWLRRQIELVDPKVVVTLGNFSSKLLLGTTTGITRLRGAGVRVVGSPSGSDVPSRCGPSGWRQGHR